MVKGMRAVTLIRKKKERKKEKKTKTEKKSAIIIGFKHWNRTNIYYIIYIDLSCIKKEYKIQNYRNSALIF